MSDYLDNCIKFENALKNENLKCVYEVLVDVCTHSNFSHFINIFLYELFTEGSDEIFVSLIESGIISPNLYWDKYPIITHASYRGSLSIVSKLTVLSKNNHWYPPISALQEAATAGYQDIFNYLFPLVKNCDPPNIETKNLNIPPEEIELLLLPHYNLCLESLNNFIVNQKLNHCLCFAKLGDCVDQIIHSSRNNSVFNHELYRNKHESALWLGAFLGDDIVVMQEIFSETNYNCQTDFRSFMPPCVSAPNKKSTVLFLPNNNHQFLAFEDKRNCTFRPPQRAKYQALTPLMAAIAGGSLVKDDPIQVFNYFQVIDILLSANPNLDLQDSDGYTVLHWAVLVEWNEAVEILLNNRFDINSKNLIGYSSFMLATSIGNLDIVNALRKAGARTEGLDQINLIQGIVNRDIDCVQSLLSKGVNPNTPNYLGEVALFIAIESEELEICQLLIDYGANLEFPETCRGDTALLAAVRVENYDITRAVLRANVNLNHHGKAWGETALIEATRYQNLDIVKLLLKHGANANLQDNFGYTAINYVEIYDRFTKNSSLIEIGLSILNSHS